MNIYVGLENSALADDHGLKSLKYVSKEHWVVTVIQAQMPLKQVYVGIWSILAEH
jgi:hypothetical protein